MEDNGIIISGICLDLGGRRILCDVSFEAPPGGFICVIGKNGAGKSTLLKCIAGVVGGYAGEIAICGKNASSLSARDRSRLVAYVPQSSPCDIPYTVRDFLEMSRYPWRGASSDADDRHALAEAMDITGIVALADRRLASLSGGERQKVMIASAIAQGTGTVLMDEPTTYLDYAHQVETIEMMARVNRDRGVTMIVVTHDINLAMELSDMVVAMSGGRIDWAGSPSGLFEPGRLNGIFGVSFRKYSSGNSGEYQILVPERTAL